MKLRQTILIVSIVTVIVVFCLFLWRKNAVYTPPETATATAVPFQPTQPNSTDAVDFGSDLLDVFPPVLGDSEVDALLRRAKLDALREAEWQAILREPLDVTLEEIHDHHYPTTGMMHTPEGYIKALRQIPRVKKLLRIAADGSQQEKRELKDYIDKWTQRYLNEYKLANYIDEGPGVSGYDALSPGADETLLLVLVELDASRETLHSLVSIFDKHNQALDAHLVAEGLEQFVDDVHHSDFIIVIADASARLVERSLKVNASWIDAAGVRDIFEEALRTTDPSTSGRYREVLHVARTTEY